MNSHPHVLPPPPSLGSPDAADLARRRSTTVRIVMLWLAVAALGAMTVLAILQDRRQAIAREQDNAVKVADGVQMFATEVIGQAVDTLRTIEQSMPAIPTEDPNGSAVAVLTNASRHDHATLALGVRQRSGNWLVAGRDGPLTLGPDFAAALEEDHRTVAPPGPRVLPAVFLPALGWCLPIRLGPTHEAVGPAAQLVALVPVRRLVETSASMRVLAGGYMVFTSPGGSRLFRYFEQTGRVDVDRSPMNPVVQDHLKSGGSGSFELTGVVTGEWTHFSYSASRSLPLVVLVAVPAPVIEQSWLSRSTGLVLCLLVAGLAAIVFGAWLYAARAALARKTTLYRSLSDSVAERTTRDPLTGLLDRYAFQRRIQQAIADRRDRPLGIVSLDLNRFKEVNESLGHAAGDATLRAIAERLTQRFGSDAGFIARLGGDDIALCVPFGALDAQVEALCTEIYNVIAEPLTISGVSLTMTASLGAAVYPDDSLLPAELLRNAEMAMFEAKRELRTYARYTPALDRFSAGSLALRCDFSHALRHGGLSLVYQPKVTTATGKLVGVEALARWKHAEKGFISPAEFVPLAETTELIHPFTQFVLTSALAQCRSWHQRGWRVPVAVNVSVNNLMDSHFVAMVSELLACQEVPPDMLELEVTESSLARDPELALTRLAELRQLGVHLSIDDFGTGYSSLAYLKRLPVDSLKLDRSFTSELATDEGDRRIVESTIRLGHGFGMKVVAEGVETAEVAALLVRMGCDISQGYYHARPMPAPEFEARWLAVPDGGGPPPPPA